MYIVVSRWEILPGKDEEFEAAGRKMRAFIRSQPGVSFADGFRTENGGVVAVIGYESQQAYNRIVNEPNGPFETAARENSLEECGRWINSERGESLDQAVRTTA